MALDIPNTPFAMDSLFKGVQTGSDLIHKMMLNKYYGTLHPSGDVANAMYVQQLKNQYGENDPRYVEAKRAHDLMLQGRQSLMNYRDVLNKTAGMRATSPLGKEILEGQGQGAQDILNRNQAPTQGVVPGINQNTSNPRTPEEREAYERSINKKTSDPKTRDILMKAENLDKTRKAINIEDLTRYSGIENIPKYLHDSVQGLFNPSNEYQAHKEALVAAGLMVHQMRQFYGDSIQPAAMKKLENLAQPSTWYKHSKIAEKQVNKLNQILDTETATYRKYGTSPIRLNKLDFKDGNFVLSKTENDKNEGVENDTVKNNNYDWENVLPALMEINPKYTQENIIATAKARNTTVDNVVDQLFQKAVKEK